jgi:type II secretion system protein G
MLSREHRRHGFTLAEVLVALTLIAILASVVVPAVTGRLQQSYEDAIVAELASLASAVTAYRQDVGKYPPALDYLTTLRAPPLDRCGTPLNAREIANWRGPYVTRAILNTSGYIFAQKDTVTDIIATSASPAGIVIQLRGPDTLTASKIDLVVDGVASATAGGLQWAANATDVTISYLIPTKSGSC